MPASGALDGRGSRPRCLSAGVGNAFEVWLGHRRRAPAWAREACLEWAFRLVQEPRRLAGRYARSNLLFLLALPGWLWTTRRISNWRES
ncbi:MAG: WecB/TagA/CpsF family glycosyltransferase [Fibrobacteres bacterium]|nr:WecB/TagA/CpsF family glycosyltransferase [Fibrobacterota bacterium]